MSVNLDQLTYAINSLKICQWKKGLTRWDFALTVLMLLCLQQRYLLKILKWTDLNVVSAPKIGLADGLILLQYKKLKTVTS
jgi:DMSO reductase anchor subunit